jgi:hypothetical protein
MIFLNVTQSLLDEFNSIKENKQDHYNNYIIKRINTLFKEAKFDLKNQLDKLNSDSLKSPQKAAQLKEKIRILSLRIHDNICINEKINKLNLISVPKDSEFQNMLIDGIYCDRLNIFYSEEIYSEDIEDKYIYAIICSFFNAWVNFYLFFELKEHRKIDTLYFSALHMYWINIIKEKLWFAQSARYKLFWRMVEKYPNIINKYGLSFPTQLQSDFITIISINSTDEDYIKEYGTTVDNFSTRNVLESKFRHNYMGVKYGNGIYTGDFGSVACYFEIIDGEYHRTRWNCTTLKEHNEQTKIVKTMLSY